MSGTSVAFLFHKEKPTCFPSVVEGDLTIFSAFSGDEADMKMTLRFFFRLFLAFASINCFNCFSIKAFTADISSIIRSNNKDATTLPPALFEKIKSPQLNAESSNDKSNPIPCFVTVSSDLQSAGDPISAQDYIAYTSKRYSDCVQLFDRYECKTLRCERVVSGSALKTIEEYNIRWQTSWISPSSVWLYELADNLDWDIQTKVPDPSRISKFSWNGVAQVFQKAFQTGSIDLPLNVVEGNTQLKISEQKNSNHVSILSISIKESIDLIRESDMSRLLNRKVAQELASWLDVSRRPLNMDGKEENWAGIVRDRVLTNVPGAGALDIDPNDENDGPGALLVFGALGIISFGFLFSFLIDEVVGNTGQVSKLCENAEKLEFGSGYVTECFGLFGDGPFL